jgi:hypothetical protein
MISICLVFFLAGVVELADALDSKSSLRKKVRVQFPPPAPKKIIKKLAEHSF